MNEEVSDQDDEVTADEGTITFAINQARKKPGELPIGTLWEYFFERLCRFSKKRIFQRHRRHIDPEDIASSTFMAFIKELEENGVERVRSREDLWKWLTLVAKRKAINANKLLDAQKRGGGRVRGDSMFGSRGMNSVVEDKKRMKSLHDFEESFSDLMMALPDDGYRKLAMMRLAGYSNEEIGEESGCSTRTVERKIQTIRKIWERLDEEE